MSYTHSIYKCSIGHIPVVAMDASREMRMKVEKDGEGRIKSNKRDLCGPIMTMCHKLIITSMLN